jgi:ribosomal protein L19
VHPAVPSIRATAPDPLPGFTAGEIARLDPTGARANLVSRTRPDAAREGDILLVTPKNGESFAGVLMQIRRRGTDTAIQLRGQALGTGVEMWYKIFSPQIVGIDIVWRRPKRARRARLTYMRKPKHDMGDVTKYVIDWRREQRQLRTKVRSKGGPAKKQF